ncbi:MAG: type VI secretion system tip protein VgrG [FCB group bacterium]|nr:type VI secretion system tip protein VgrG [FCB group bacterium]
MPSRRQDLGPTSSVVSTSAVCELVVDGKKTAYDISGIVLEQFIDNHHVLKIKIRGVGQETGDQDFGSAMPYTSYLGKSISLTIKPEGHVVDAARELGFIGIITKIDLDNSIDAINQTTITAHSPTLAMDGAKHNAFYHDQSASDVIGAILRNYPMTLGKTESASGSMKFSVQYRETDYEYVMRLAGGCEMFAFYEGKEFRLVKASSADTEELAWRETLGSFSLGLGTTASEFNARTYNYEQKKTFGQDTKSLTQQASLSDISKLSPDASKKVYPDSGVSQAATSVADAQSLDKILQREKSRAMGRMIRCTGQSNVPAVAVGHCVKVKGMDQIDGVYWILSVKHVFDESSAYQNTFTCTPLDIAFPQPQSARRTESHLQSAVVVNNVDPDGLGRVKVKFPWNDSDETPWLRIAVPHAGQDRGWSSLPEIDDEVLVGYEQGSPDLPIVIGALYNKDNKPHPDTGDDENNIKMFMTRCGHKIVLDDTDGEEKISIITKDDKNAVVMDVAAPSISIKSEGDIGIEAKGDLSLKGANVNIESEMDTKLKVGISYEEEIGVNFKSKGGGIYDMEGLVVTIKGQVINLN